MNNSTKPFVLSKFNRYLQTGIIVYSISLIINIVCYLFFREVYNLVLLISGIIFTATVIIISSLLFITNKDFIKKYFNTQKTTTELTDNSNLCIIKLNKELEIIYVNNKFCTLTGYTREELISGNFKDKLGLSNFNLPKISNTNHSNLKLKFTNKLGDDLTILWNSFIDNESNIFGYCIDISKVQKIELTLRNSLLEYNALFNNSTIGFIIISSDKKIARINKKVVEILGFEASEILGSSLETIIADTERDIPEFIDSFHNNTSGLVFSMQHKNGSLVWVTASSRPVKLEYIENGAIISIQDITDQKNAETELIKKQEQLDFVLNGAELATWEWNIEENSVRVNNLWIDRLGYKSEEIEPIREHWDKLMHPEDRDKVYEKMNEHILGHTDMFLSRHRYFKKNNEIIWFDETARIVERNKKGEPLKIAGIQRNITLEKEEELTRSLLVDISSDLIECTPENLDQTIHKALTKCGILTNTDIAFIYELEPDKKTFSNRYEWSRKKEYSQIDTMKRLKVSDFSWGVEMLTNNKHIVVENMEDIPDYAINERRIFQIQNVKSVILVPMTLSGDMFGYIGFSCIRNTKKWSPTTIALLEIMGNQIAKTVENKRIQSELKLQSQILKISNNKLEKIHQIAKVGEWSYNSRNNTFKLSDLLYRSVGISRENNISSMEQMKKISDPEYFKKNYNYFIKHAIKGETGSIIHKLYNTNGDEKYFEIFFQNASKFNKEDSISGIAIDITELVQKNRALKLANEKYHNIIENTGNILYTVNREKTILMANKEFENFTGYSKQEVENKMKWTDLIVKEDLNRLLKINSLRLKDSESAESKFNFRIIDKNNNIHNVMCKIGVLKEGEEFIVSLTELGK